MQILGAETLQRTNNVYVIQTAKKSKKAVELNGTHIEQMKHFVIAININIDRITISRIRRKVHVIARLKLEDVDDYKKLPFVVTIQIETNGKDSGF